jgi:hypothetical protein
MRAIGSGGREIGRGVDAASTMRRPPEAAAVPIQYLRSRVADRPMAEPADRETVVPVLARVVRCACEECGAHTNAVRTFRLRGSCPTCGSFYLVALEGAELMDGQRRVA